jgi:hypothetical protein
MKITRYFNLAVIFLLFFSLENIQLALPVIIFLFYISQRKTFLFDRFLSIFKNQFFIRLITALFIYQFLNYIFSLITTRTDILAFPLFILSFYLPFTFLVIPKKDNYLVIKRVITFIIFIQALLVIGYGLFFKGNIIIPGDWARGTVLWAYWLGFCIIWFLWDLFFKKEWKVGDYFLLVPMLFVLFLTESKAVIIIGIISSLLSAIIMLFSSQSSFPNYIIKTGGFIVMLLFVLFLNLGFDQFYVGTKNKIALVKNIKETEKYVESYSGGLSNVYIKGESNHKFLFIKRGWEYILRNNLVFIGTSPGTLGSRASNLRARDILFKPEGAKLAFLPAYSSAATKEVYNNLYSEEYFKKAASCSSTLALPFSGFFSFLFENGVIGMILLLLTVGSLIKVYYRGLPGPIFLILFIFLWGIFDTVWERPFIMGFFYLILRLDYLEAKYRGLK